MNERDIDFIKKFGREFCPNRGHGVMIDGHLHEVSFSEGCEAQEYIARAVRPEQWRAGVQCKVVRTIIVLADDQG